ncbi:MAG: pyridoxal phosphate-dependent aminotransferase [Acidobacteriota bacterium]|nr:pyridoxal phosphate-dependent aminotransferase [Acidobacteriota bacterium]
MQFSERISRISVSPTLAVSNMAAKMRASGVDVVDFGAGEPDFATPENIKRAAIEAIHKNFTKYTPTGGTAELKKAVVERHAHDFGSDYKPEESLITVGGKQAIYEAVAALINHCDEVILPVPYWVSFLDIVNYAGGKVVLLETRESEGFAIRAEAVEKLVTPKTRILIVNSPSNPSGAVVPPEEMQKLLALAERRNFLLMSDECYCHFLYDGKKPFSLGASRNRENLLIVGSLSKTYSMTGWRVGFALGQEALLKKMLNLQSHSTSNPTSIAQKAAVEALNGPQESVEAMLAEYARRRQKIVAGLRAIQGIECVMPAGAFYAYPNMGGVLKLAGMKDATELAAKLLEEVQVALVPGPAFGTREHVRISYATSEERIEEGLKRLKQFVSRLVPAHAQA